MKYRPSVSHDEWMVRKLRRDRAFAIEYLKAAFEDEEVPAVRLIALRHVAEAYGGIARIAKAAGVERESLYRILSAKGNPTLATITAVTRAMGFRLTLEPVSGRKRARKAA